MNFRKFLDESKQQLDISIQAAGKWLTSNKKIEELLSSTVEIEHKTDGVKLTVIKQANNGNLKDWIFAYKGNVLYSTEYDYQPYTKVKKEAIGASQFRAVFQHFNKLKATSIPIGTELFIEFLMQKPTLSSNYSTKHKMVLIGYCKSKYTEKFGKLKTQPSGMLTEKRNKFSKELKIDVPQLLFKGVMETEKSFSKGIQNKILQKEFTARKQSMSWDMPELLLDDIREMFLSIESKYGGKEEGVVIKYNGRILKWQQSYQLDQEARAQIKMKYRDDDPVKETIYWNNVKRIALDISNNFVVKSRKLPDLLKELSLVIKKTKIDFKHDKKPLSVIKDDIQLNVKQLIIKKMRGNNNALVIGKFRILTKQGHVKLFKRAQTIYDELVICIISNKDTLKTKDLREKMIRKVAPKAHIIHARTANIISIINKSPVNINAIYAGSDRVQAYRNQTKNMMGMDVKELPRTNDDISASKVIENINDEDFFNKHTPKEVHSLYNILKGIYGKV